MAKKTAATAEPGVVLIFLADGIRNHVLTEHGK